LLEDVGERPYRIDRMLTDLIAGRHLTRASAIIVGDFTDCTPGPDGRTVEHVLRERLGAIGVPVVAGFPSGHGKRNDAVVFGHRAEVDARRGDCTIG
jgi:muramoyltetrapeptide carboxypeptidase